jgi:hypothetical protein
MAGAEKTRIEMIGAAYDGVTGRHAQMMQQSLVAVEMRKALPKTSILFEGGSGGACADVKSGFNSAQGFMLAKNANIEE